MVVQEKRKNKKGKAISLKHCFQCFWLKKALNIKQIKTKTITFMVAVNKKLFSYIAGFGEKIVSFASHKEAVVKNFCCRSVLTEINWHL